jgi:centrosomal protein CEP41
MMQRKAPENARYSTVKSRISTGSVKGKTKLVTSSERAKRLNENFFRIGSRELSELFEEYERNDAEEEVLTHSYGRPDYNPRVVVHEAEAKPVVERPYLILDVRDEAEFLAGHLTQALNFPQRLLMQDRSTKELVNFKNREGKLVVLYDDAPQQRLAGAAAQILATRGFDNVYVLVGGLSEFSKRQGMEFVNGSVGGDENINHAATRGGGSSSSSSSSSINSNNNNHSKHGGGASYDSRNDEDERRSHAGSMHSKMDSMRSQCKSSVGPHSSGRSRMTARDSNVGTGLGGQQNKLVGAKGRDFRGGGLAIMESNEDAASHMSNASVADSVISRAMSRKAGGGSGAGRYR